jgi:hypothetical protein
MSREKMARAMARKPPDGDFKKLVFWLVDVIYACKASQDEAVVGQSHLLEDALGALGHFLETGDQGELAATQRLLGEFAHFVGHPGAQGSRAAP